MFWCASSCRQILFIFTANFHLGMGIYFYSWLKGGLSTTSFRWGSSVEVHACRSNSMKKGDKKTFSCINHCVTFIAFTTCQEVRMKQIWSWYIKYLHNSAYIFWFSFNYQRMLNTHTGNMKLLKKICTWWKHITNHFSLHFSYKFAFRMF